MDVGAALADVHVAGLAGGGDQGAQLLGDLAVGSGAGGKDLAEQVDARLVGRVGLDNGDRRGGLGIVAAELAHPGDHPPGGRRQRLAGGGTGLLDRVLGKQHRRRGGDGGDRLHRRPPCSRL